MGGAKQSETTPRVPQWIVPNVSSSQPPFLSLTRSSSEISLHAELFLPKFRRLRMAVDGEPQARNIFPDEVSFDQILMRVAWSSLSLISTIAKQRIQLSPPLI